MFKGQVLFDVADPDFDPDDGDQYENQLFLEKLFCVQRKRIGQGV